MGLIHLFAYPIHLLVAHGYAALFVWSLLEGEIGLMLAGWLASLGVRFRYEEVVAVAMAGALIGDHVLFFTGRLFQKRARAWLEAHPERAARSRRWLRRWGPWVILFERFVYGTHIPVLLTIGMSGYRYGRFLLFDLMGVAAWALTFVSIGYVFGEKVIELTLFVQKNLLLIPLLIGIFVIIFHPKNGDRGA